MRKTMLLAAIAAAATLSACGSAAPITVRGMFTVSSFDNSGSTCYFTSDSGYSDITPGTQVVVTAPDGTVLGSGSLRSPEDRNNGLLCAFPFTVRGVKGGEARYGISVSKRGTVWFSPRQIADPVLGLSS